MAGRRGSRDRGTHEGGLDTDSDNNDLAPGRRTLTQKLGRLRHEPPPAPDRAQSDTHLNAEALEDRDHWLDKFGIDIATGNESSTRERPDDRLGGSARSVAHDIARQLGVGSFRLQLDDEATEKTQAHGARGVTQGST